MVYIPFFSDIIFFQVSYLFPWLWVYNSCMKIWKEFSPCLELQIFMKAVFIFSLPMRGRILGLSPRILPVVYTLHKTLSPWVKSRMGYDSMIKLLSSWICIGQKGDYPDGVDLIRWAPRRYWTLPEVRHMECDSVHGVALGAEGSPWLIANKTMGPWSYKYKEINSAEAWGNFEADPSLVEPLDEEIVPWHLDFNLARPWVEDPLIMFQTPNSQELGTNKYFKVLFVVICYTALEINVIPSENSAFSVFIALMVISCWQSIFPLRK